MSAAWDDHEDYDDDTYDDDSYSSDPLLGYFGNDPKPVQDLHETHPALADMADAINAKLVAERHDPPTHPLSSEQMKLISDKAGPLGHSIHQTQDSEYLYNHTHDRADFIAQTFAVPKEPEPGKEGVAVGNLSWGSRDAEVAGIEVDPAHRGKGLATRMIREATSYADNMPGVAKPGPSPLVTEDGLALYRAFLKKGLPGR